jgi:hypothetical protein
VIRSEVEFRSQDALVRGTLLLPAGGAGPHPAVIMGGGWRNAKEIVLPHDAETLVGAVVSMLDDRHVGASEGEPRQHMDPGRQNEDYRNAITDVSGLHEIDADRIGVWANSRSGGQAIVVSATDPRVECVISDIPIDDSDGSMRRIHGSARFNPLPIRLVEDRKATAATWGAWGRVPMSSVKPFENPSRRPFPLTHEISHDIEERGAALHGHWSAAEAAEPLPGGDVSPFARRLHGTPILLVVVEGDEIALRDPGIEPFDAIPSAQKRRVVIPHVSRMNLHSQTTHLQTAGEATAAFVRKRLVETGGAAAKEAA